MDNCPTCGALLLQGEEFCVVCNAEVEAPTLRALDPDLPSEDGVSLSVAGNGPSAAAKKLDLIPVRRVFALIGMLLALFVALVVTGVLTPAEAPGQTAPSPPPPSEVVDRDVVSLCARTVPALPAAPSYESAVAGAHALQLVDLRSSLGVPGEDFALLENWIGDPAELVLCIREVDDPKASTVNCRTSSGVRELAVEAQSVLVELRSTHTGRVLWADTYRPDRSVYCDLVDSGNTEATLSVSATLPTEQIAFVVSRWATTPVSVEN